MQTETDIVIQTLECLPKQFTDTKFE